MPFWLAGFVAMDPARISFMNHEAYEITHRANV